MKNLITINSEIANALHKLTDQNLEGSLIVSKAALYNLLGDLQACKVGDKKGHPEEYQLMHDTEKRAYNNGISDAMMKIEMHMKLIKATEEEEDCLEDKLIGIYFKKSYTGVGEVTQEEEEDCLEDKLIGIYFKKSYTGVGEVTQEEEAFLDNNTFICKVTEDTKNAGYNSDKKQISDLLEIGIEYELSHMDVGQSNSSVSLKEFPNERFNSVNFEFSLKE